MSGPNPNCRRCGGKGHYRGPWYGDFEPRIVDLTCECFEHSRPTRGEVALLVIGFICLFALMLGGAR